MAVKSGKLKTWHEWTRRHRRVHVLHSGAPGQRAEAARFMCVESLCRLISSLVMQGNSSHSSSEVFHVGIQMSQMNGRARFGRQRSNRGFGHDAGSDGGASGSTQPWMGTGCSTEEGSHPREEQKANTRLMKLPVQQTEGSRWSQPHFPVYLLTCSAWSHAQTCWQPATNGINSEDSLKTNTLFCRAENDVIGTSARSHLKSP